MKKARKLRAAKVNERLASLRFRHNTWSGLEMLAGVTDRDAFWKGKSEAQARIELLQMIRSRLERGELLDDPA